MYKKQGGFSLPHVLLVLVLVGIVGFAGWRVYEARKETDKSLDNASKANEIVEEEQKQQAKPAYKIPEGYIKYENKDLGFSFAYPKEYGALSVQPPVNQVKILQSQEPSSPYGPGIAGKFQVYTYASPSQEITSRKYGPKITLQNGKWIVTQANQADITGNKVGDVYKDFDKKEPAAQTNDGLTVYTLVSPDEGTKKYRLVLVANNMLHEIYTPAFSDGTYANFGDRPPNDPAKFNELLKNVTDSIHLYK